MRIFGSLIDDAAHSTKKKLKHYLHFSLKLLYLVKNYINKQRVKLCRLTLSEMLLTKFTSL